MTQKKNMPGVLHILLLMLILAMTSCENDDDYRAPSTIPTTDYDFAFTYQNSKGYVYTVQEHTKGVNGFPVVIFADGYTDKEIDSGMYDKAVSNAVTAMQSQEPMSDLIDYLDIYKVVVSSEESGINYTKHNTAFSSYLESKQNTNICCDTTKAIGFAYLALRKNDTRMHNALVIMLLNTSEYAGVTLMTLDTNVTDSIPEGYSLSLIPAYATVSNGDNVFRELILHEAVGHGIGKLGDEYYYNQKPTSTDIEDFKKNQKYGWMSNIKYFDYEYTGSIDKDYVYKQDKTGKYYIQRTTDASEDLLVPFASDSRYASEEHKWIQGGYTFITLRDDRQYSEYVDYIDENGHVIPVKPYLCEANFYRSSGISIMGDVVNYKDLKFNVLSRMALYKRINRVANGSGWKFDYNTFMDFDKPSSKVANTRKLYTMPTPYYNTRRVEESNKHKAKPVIIR